MAIQLDPVSRDRLADFIKDPATIFDFERLFEAVIELQSQVAALEAVAASAGDIVWSAGTTRAGALPALGGSYLRADYPALFAVIGTTYGAVDATHFTMPDIGGRVVAAKEAVATRLTAAVAGFSGATLGAAGGDQRLHGHTHSVTYAHPANVGVDNSANLKAVPDGDILNSSTGTTGSGTAQNVQPTIVLNAFILTGSV
jgi:microcystin-dependent protein